MTSFVKRLVKETETSKRHLVIRTWQTALDTFPTQIFFRNEKGEESPVMEPFHDNSEHRALIRHQQCVALAESQEYQYSYQVPA